MIKLEDITYYPYKHDTYAADMCYFIKDDTLYFKSPSVIKPLPSKNDVESIEDFKYKIYEEYYKALINEIANNNEETETHGNT